MKFTRFGAIATAMFAITTLLSTSVLAVDSTLVTSNDTYIRDGFSHTVNGATDNMDFRYDFTAYFQFDMSALNIDTISSATLSLHKIGNARNDTLVNGRVDAYGLTDDPNNTLQYWDELADFDPNDATNGLDFRNVGADWVAGTGAISSQLTNLDQDNGAVVTETSVNDIGDGTGLYTITGTDLVAFLNSRADDTGLVTFVMEQTDAGGRGWGWATKEHADSNLHPTLDLTYTELIPEPASFALLATAALAIVLSRKR